MTSRKLLPFTTFLLAMLGLFLLAQTLPAHSQGNPAADLVLHKAVTPLTALEPGDEIQYTLTFSNAGVLTATEVLISDTLPSLLMDVTVASNLPITSTGHDAWIVGFLPPGAGGTITLTGQISPALTSELTFTNTATISTPITDTVPTNNTSSVVSEVNLPPVVDAGPNASATVGQPFTLTASFTEPGLDDTHTAVIAWGDGLTGTAVLSETAHTLNAMHVYTATGAFTVTVGVVDSDGGQGEDGVVITVEQAIYFQYLPVLYNFLGNPMNYVEVSPFPNQMISNQQTAVVATYSLHLREETVTPQNFVLHSLQGGVVTGTIHVENGFNGDNLIWTPGRSFAAGEVFQATLTTELAGLMGINILHPDYPKVWQFQIGPSGGSGYMFPANVPTFGGGNSTDLAWGDVDGDGDGDVLVTNEDQPATVWLNDGQGAFTPHPTTPELGVGGEQAIALGDLDNDRDVDAVLATFGAETVWVNDGLGNFTPHPTAPTFGAGTSLDIALGDLNGDGFLDAVVANTNGEPETVWQNDGTGAFVPHPTMPTFGAGDSTSVALGDVDGDFDLDAVIANTNGEPETVWSNDTTGQFTPHGIVPEFGAEDSQAVRLGDLDSDGDVDAVVANALGEPETVWMNDGTGGFFAYFFPASFGTGDSTDLALGDLDGDMDFDVVVANANGDPETVWLNDGVGGFSAHPGNPMFGEGDSQGVVLGNLDGDGDLEGIFANNGTETVWANQELKVVATTPEGNGGIVSQNGSIRITFNFLVDVSTINSNTFIVNGAFTGVYQGTYSFPAPDQVEFSPSTPFLPGEQIFITLNHSILSDAQIPLKPFARAFRVEVQGGTGSFELQTNDSVDFMSHYAVLGDLDGDRDLDVITSDRPDSENHPSVWLNDGHGVFTPHPTQPVINDVGDTWGVVLGDLDQDSDLDVIFNTNVDDPSFEHIATVWLNDGVGQFTYYQTFETELILSAAMQAIQLADIDGDGDLDALGGANIWLNNGTGLFSLGLIAPTNAYMRDVGDVDNDGDFDLIFVSYIDFDSAQIWKNNGAGNFTLETMFVDTYVGHLKLGDIDGDHDLDLIVETWWSSKVLLNDGEGNFAFNPKAPYIEPAFTDLDLGDLDGDQDLDLAIASTAYWYSSTNWINDGQGNFTLHPIFPSFETYDEVFAFGDLDGDGDLDILRTRFHYPAPFYSHSVWLNKNE